VEQQTFFEHLRNSGLPGEAQLGQYRILDELGRGGFGCVYKAMHVLMNRLVALKVISPDLVEDRQARSWFLREVLATTQLFHPNIVMAYDANEVENVLFLAMEYVEGPNLDQLVKKNGPLPIGLACALLLQVGRALDYAHEQGMVHRDIKPANLLIPNRPRPSSDPEAANLRSGSGLNNTTVVKVVDFGLARLQSNCRSNTISLDKDKSFIGTPGYVAPEQARSIHDADIRSDLYSLGCTIYFALSGKAPFRGKTPLEVLMRNLEKEAEPLQSLRPEVPPALANIVRRLMTKKPEQRFRTPADMLAEMSFLFGSLPVAAPPSMASQPSAPPVSATRHETPLPAEGSELSVTVRVPVDAHSTIAVGDKPPQCDAEDPQATRLADWKQWMAVVSAITECRSPGIGESAYRALHSRIVKSIRSEIHRADSKANASWQGVDNLVAPWVTLHALAAMDLKTAASLYQRCQVLGRQAGWGLDSRRGWNWLGLAASLLIAVGLGMLLIMRPGIVAGFSLPSTSTVWKFVQTYPFVALVPVAVLGSVWLLPRCLRS
jgi:eukaryotic-like serine/threonine-protein kinase